MAGTGQRITGRKGEDHPLAGLDFLDRIADRLESFTPTQRTLAEYLVHNPESLLFMSAQELAAQAQVSQATVVRFCNALGYEGYSRFSKEARHTIHSQMDSAGRFQHRGGRNPQTTETDHRKWADSTFLSIVDHELDSLARLSGSIRVDDFNRAVDRILAADRVMVIGCLSSASLAVHFGNMVSKIVPHTDVITSEGVVESARINALTEKSVVFVVAFPRYPNPTIRLGKAAAETPAFVVSITNSHVSPISALGRLAFHIQIGMPSFLDAYSAPLTFINALAAETADRMPDRAARLLAAWDESAEKMDLLHRPVRRGRPNKNS